MWDAALHMVVLLCNTSTRLQIIFYFTVEPLNVTCLLSWHSVCITLRGSTQVCAAMARAGVPPPAPSLAASTGKMLLKREETRREQREQMQSEREAGLFHLP